MLKWLVTNKSPDSEFAAVEQKPFERKFESLESPKLLKQHLLSLKLKENEHMKIASSIQNERKVDESGASYSSVRSKIGSFQSKINTYQETNKDTKVYRTLVQNDGSSRNGTSKAVRKYVQQHLPGEPQNPVSNEKYRKNKTSKYVSKSIMERELINSVPESVYFSEGFKWKTAHVTDDPLAILPRKDDAEPDEIYAVSRWNPLFLEENVKTQSTGSTYVKVPSPDSPVTDHNSVRSSGYGSKENDSASDISERSEGHEEEISDHEHNREYSIYGTVTSGETERVTKSKLFRHGSEECELVLPLHVAQLKKSFEHREPSVPLRNFNPISSVSLKEPPDKSGKPVMIYKNPKYVGSVHVGMRKVRSLENIYKPSKELTCKKVISCSLNQLSPSQKWSRVSNHGDSSKRQSERIPNRRGTDEFEHQSSNSEEIRPQNGQVIRFNPLVSVVTQNSRYVTAITVSPRKEPLKPRMSCYTTKSSDFTYIGVHIQNDINSIDNSFEQFKLPFLVESDSLMEADNIYSEERIANYFGSSNKHSSTFSTNSGDYPLMSLQPDSLITEDTLRMMTYPDYKINSQRSEDAAVIEPKCDSKQEINQIMYTRGLYATLNRNSLLQSEDRLRRPGKSKKSLTATSKCSDCKDNKQIFTKSTVKKKGLDTVRDLWEKTGLKTNGRKLVVDLDDIVDGKEEKNPSDNKLCPRCRNQLDVNNQCSYCPAFQSTEVNVKTHSLEQCMTFQSIDDNNQTNEQQNDNHYLDSQILNESLRGYDSVEHFGLDNFAFVDDHGNKSNALQIMSSRSKSHNGVRNNFPQSPQTISELENSDLTEVLVDQLKHNGTSANRTNNSEQTLTQTSDIHSSKVKKGNVITTLDRKDSSGIVTSMTPHSETDASVRRHGTVSPSALLQIHALELSEKSRVLERTDSKYQSARAATAGPSKTAQDVFTINGNFVVSDQPVTHGTFTRTVGGVDRITSHAEGQSQSVAIVFWQSGLIPALRQMFSRKDGANRRKYSRKLSPHPNSAALHCRDEQVLCADFTLDLPTEGGHGKSQDRSSKCCKRTLLLFFALAVFIGIMVAVSYYLTGGKRIFGPM